MGGGVTGLATALLLARAGHTVTLLDRDDLAAGESAAAPDWRRRGVPHFLQPHAFIPRGRAELKNLLPDVYDVLIRAGADDIDVRKKLPAEPEPDDADLFYLGVRRPVIEWALRRAVLAEPGIAVRSGAQIQGIRVEHGCVSGIRVNGAEVSARVLVDALGRRSPSTHWLAESGISLPPAVSSNCGVIYYSRYYRVRNGFELPEGPWILSPRGDLGYLGFASFPGDDGTFAALLAVPTGDPDWRVLKEAAAFEAVIKEIPMIRQWVDPAGTEPIAQVLPMAGLRNSLRAFDGAQVPGLFHVGDALGHTDPVLAHGLAFGLIHAAALNAALRDYDDLRDAFAYFSAATGPELGERYELASALDEQRHRMWVGEPVDFARRDGDYALFSMVAAGAAAATDPQIFRAFVRRIGLLDSTAVLDEDVALQARIEDIFQKLIASPRPPSGPPREELLAIAVAAVGP